MRRASQSGTSWEMRTQQNECGPGSRYCQSREELQRGSEGGNATRQRTRGAVLCSGGFPPFAPPLGAHQSRHAPACPRWRLPPHCTTSLQTPHRAPTARRAPRFAVGAAHCQARHPPPLAAARKWSPLRRQQQHRRGHQQPARPVCLGATQATEESSGSAACEDANCCARQLLARVEAAVPVAAWHRPAG